MKIVGYFTYYKEISTGIISVVHKLYLFINTNVKLKKTKKKKDIFWKAFFLIVFFAFC